MPSAPASSSDSSSRSQAARSDGEDERCHAGSPSITSDAWRSAAGVTPRCTAARASPQEAEKP